MKIISHRGAAGLTPENTILGIEVARQFKVEYIEIDVHVTKDERLVLLHDETYRAKTGVQIKVKDATLSAIQKDISLDSKVATLEEAFKAAGQIPLLIDCKGEGWQEPLAKLLKRFKVPRPIVASDDHRQLFAFAEKAPDADCFLSELTSPFDTIQTAKALGFSGICMLYSIYNPLVYFLAKRHKLKMTMFTVNRPVFAWFLHFFYPEVYITTDYPDRFAPKLKRQRIKLKRRKSEV